MADKDKDPRSAFAQARASLKPAQDAARRLQAKRMQQLENLLDRGTEEEVLELILSAGIDPESTVGKKVIRIWRENRRS